MGQYLDVFRDRQPEQERSGPKLVYICAPLRGDVEQNIEFARQKAQEVFQDGDIPVCPHLMFPPIADPDHPVQDQQAREAGLRLVESCQQVNVYGPVCHHRDAQIVGVVDLRPHPIGPDPVSYTHLVYNSFL